MSTLQAGRLGTLFHQRRADVRRPAAVAAMLTTRWFGRAEPSRIRWPSGSTTLPGGWLDTFTPAAGSPRIELLRSSDADLLDAVRNRAADIAIAPWPKRPTGLDHTVRASGVLVAAVPAGSALADGDAVRAASCTDDVPHLRLPGSRRSRTDPRCVQRRTATRRGDAGAGGPLTRLRIRRWRRDSQLP